MTAERVVARLLASKQIEERRAAEARTSANREGVPLGRWLMDAGWVSPDIWSNESAAVLGITFAESPGRDADAQSRWPADFFARHACLPLRIEEGRLILGVVDPTDQENLEAVESFVRMPVRPVCVPERLVRNGRAVAASGGGATALALDEPQAEPHLRLLHEILRGAVRRGATDIHALQRADAGLEVRLRVDGLLGAASWSVETASAGPIVNRLRVLAGVDLTETRLPQDGSFSVAQGASRIDVRASFLPAQGGTSIVLRLLDRDRFVRSGSSLTLEGLGVQRPEREEILRTIRRPHGLVLVVGPTGSGKSTTLHAALVEGDDPVRKLVSIEDPVEYRLRDAVQVEVNERAGLTFAAGLRSVLRHDPDRILVGEIRDGETAAIAIQAALTGHLVLTTLHATSALDVDERMRALGVDPATVKRALSILVVQRLARRTCTACKAAGCPGCEGSGYRGRLAITEVSRSEDHGLRPLRPAGEVASQLISSGVTTRAELERVWPEAAS